LLHGLADILQQIAPDMQRPVAEQIGSAVLLHPLIRETHGRLGSVIHREELTKLLLELAAGSGPQNLSNDAKLALQRTLVATGVCRDGTSSQIEQELTAKIDSIDAQALQLELLHPELTTNARARIAILKNASSTFLAKINLWFDQTIDRVSDRFTRHTRYVAFGASLVLALLIQLDTANLVSRLSSDDKLRDTLVDEARHIQQEPNPNLKLNNTEIQNIHDLMTNNVVGVPVSFSDWTRRWSRDNASMKILGILLSTVLLTLGAPFWYNTLQNLLRLRSVAAVKDDQQRVERQLAVPAAAASVAEAAASRATGTEEGKVHG
jgi:uncharacterized membrane protein YcjF (UPF0283 family)